MKLVFSAQELVGKRCAVLDNSVGNAYGETDVAAQLTVLPAWRIQEGFIERNFQFKNYFETIAFVNSLAWMIHAQDHHPELHTSFNRCLVRFNTHSVGGISLNDFICAAKADALFEQQ
jgi:4a-hydroxytetrahydrobiopterin dehydratase